jgi:hypothetical protein
VQSILARIIGIAAVLPLISSVWSFIEAARIDYQHDGPAVSRLAFQTLSEGMIAPFTLLAFAAIIEMLHRIAQRLPAPLSAVRLRPWRSRVALALLAWAGIMYLFTAWAAYAHFTSDEPFTASFPEDQRLGTLGLIFYWLTEPLWLIAMAAGVEYLSRIAAAFAPASGEPVLEEPPPG